MMSHENIIAWLVPTARGTNADKTTHMPENSHRAIDISSSSFLASRLPNLIASKPQKAIQLAFDQQPKRPGSFVLGLDPRTCDVVLPRLSGVSSQHCAIRFDAQSRIVLDDFSEQGSAVWYDWESSGDRKDYTWLLSGTPGATQRITVDIQGVRFQIVANTQLLEQNRPAYVAKVEAFCEQPVWSDGLAVDWDRASLAPVAPLFAATPLFQHIFVQGLIAADEPKGEMYLWNLSKPWEPMVRASA